MNDNIFISVVVITHNKVEYLKSVITNLENQTNIDNVEFIVVNDGSTDETKKYLDKQKSRLNFKHVSIENSGSAIARNTGIRLSEGSHILFLDNDIILAPDFLDKLKSSLNEHPDRIHSGRLRLIPLNVVPTVLEKTSNEGKIQMSFLEKNSYTDAIYGTLQIAYNGIPDADLACWWGITTGGNICFPKHVIEGCNYFDENFKGWGPEDVDLCYRAYKNNYLLKYNDDCRLYHLDHVRNDRQIKDLMARNISLFYKKYKAKEILAYLNFFNGIISLNLFNQICCEAIKKKPQIELQEYFISLDYYINKDQIINWKKNDINK